ncbi:hypothetical protein ALC57_05450 [Trachymyrmex cornetzi]|uniref:Uncharacterized protein n=1 Tax=Trachymyrmex cornetzi TaxID=471704 RepID=A0A195EAD2_9HYME|nr:hypothetical protein ALC57_05450 [Trachymyrmex cornetzi]
MSAIVASLQLRRRQKIFIAPLPFVALEIDVTEDYRNPTEELEKGIKEKDLKQPTSSPHIDRRRKTSPRVGRSLGPPGYACEGLLGSLGHATNVRRTFKGSLETIYDRISPFLCFYLYLRPRKEGTSERLRRCETDIYSVIKPTYGLSSFYERRKTPACSTECCPPKGTRLDTNSVISDRSGSPTVDDGLA